ncbi:MAG: hypothetical protein QXO70_02700 [Candidatus Pacearchaeota archaeon]
MKTRELLEIIDDMVEELLETNSKLEKIQILKRYDYPEVKKLLKLIYDPLVNFNITSESIPFSNKQNFNFELFDLLEKLSKREITGNFAREVCAEFINAYGDLSDLILCIIDKDLKCGINTKTINEAFSNLIPLFEVPLAKDFDPKFHNINGEEYFLSRKLDGVRCLCFIENGTFRFFSRNGKEFYTLKELEKELIQKWAGPDRIILDGEICIVDNKGNEHFSDIIKEIRRKDYIIPNPFFFVFDAYPIEDFSNGFSTICYNEKLMYYPNFLKGFTRIYWLPQMVIKSYHELESTMQNIPTGWEGLILRKNSPTEFKRSHTLLKVKAFKEQEYTVKGIVYGNIAIDGEDHECVGALQIEHKGNIVKVGSGLTQEQRFYWYEHPEEIVGKIITVKYFSESEDKHGNISLRFPILKGVREDASN